jgi:hypothetical protein
MVNMRFKIALFLCCALGILLRLILVIQSGWRIDYDEAMIGLLGLRVLRGEFMAFIPAQATLGALEPYLLAPLFAFFGANSITFRIYSLLCSAAYIATTGLLAQQAFGARVGILTALLAAFAPPYMLITGLKTWGTTIETIVLGNVLFLLIHRAIEKSERRFLALAGLIAGVMFWGAWLSAYYFVPTALMLLWRGRDLLRRAWWIALLCFFIGSLPFWIYNLQNDFATFRAVFNAQGSDAAFGDIFGHFVNDLMPRMVTTNPSWGSTSAWTRTMLISVYYAGVLVLITSPHVSRRRGDGANVNASYWLLASFTLLLPLIYLFSGYGDTALNPWGVDATGRYVLMLHTTLPVAVAVLIDCLRGLGRRFAQFLAAALVTLVISLNLLGAFRLDLQQAFDSPYYNRQPASLEPLISYVDEHAITRIWIDVGIGQVLMFQTNERIIAADPYDAYIAGGLLRFPDALAAVENASVAAFVVPVLPYQEDLPLRRALDSAGIIYTFDYITPTLMIFIPAQPIDPMTIASGLGYQY